MPTHYASGLDNPVVRENMMSQTQQGAVNQPVTTMGLGIQSALQSSAAGNNSLATVRKLLKIVLAEKDRKEKKDKKTKKMKAKDQQRSVGASTPPVQLPEPINPKGIA